MRGATGELPDELAEVLFLSTLPMRGATVDSWEEVVAGKFLSTLSMRRATMNPNPAKHTMRFLSTLPMRRATIRAFLRRRQTAGISIHALHAESDCAYTARYVVKKHFYPRSPCGERLYPISYISATMSISIHAPHAGSDL